MNIFSHFQGLLTNVQLAATTWPGQIWISCWILPHFDVWTISVAWKLKKLSNIFWQKTFFLLNPLSKGVAPLCNGVQETEKVPKWFHKIYQKLKCLSANIITDRSPNCPILGEDNLVKRTFIIMNRPRQCRHCQTSFTCLPVVKNIGSDINLPCAGLKLEEPFKILFNIYKNTWRTTYTVLHSILYLGIFQQKERVTTGTM